MPGIFDLTSIKRLVDKNTPPAILIVDTNIVMAEPDFSKWTISIPDAIFILSDNILQELEFLKMRPETKDKAIAAIISISNLCKQGVIAKGITVPKIGLFISVPAPKSKKLNSALDEWEDAVKTFKRTDTVFILLTRELNKALMKTTTLFLTGELNLFNFMDFNGIPTYLFKGFPIADLEKRLVKKPTETDWDGLLRKIHESRPIDVELTLTSRYNIPSGILPEQPGPKKPKYLVAEGYGLIHHLETGNISFKWTFPYQKYRFLNDEVEGSANEIIGEFLESYINNIFIDFLGQKPIIPKVIMQNIVLEMHYFAFPLAYVEGLPTLQDVNSVIQMFLSFDYYSDKAKKSLDHMNVELKQQIKNSGNLIDFITEWILDLQQDDADRYAVLSNLLDAVLSCWDIGGN